MKLYSDCCGEMATRLYKNYPYSTEREEHYTCSKCHEPCGPIEFEEEATSKCCGAKIKIKYFSKLGDGTWDWDRHCFKCNKPCKPAKEEK